MKKAILLALLMGIVAGAAFYICVYPLAALIIPNLRAYEIESSVLFGLAFSGILLYSERTRHPDVFKLSNEKNLALTHAPAREFLSNRPEGFTIGRFKGKYVFIPFTGDLEHSIIVGAPGDGKSSTIQNAIIWNFNYASPEEKLTSMLVVDIKGELKDLGVFDKCSDAVRLDPTVKDSYGYDLYYELNKESSDDDIFMVCNGIACTIVPEGDEKNRTFWGGARIILTGFLGYAYLRGLTFGETIEEIHAVPAEDLIATMMADDMLNDHQRIRSTVSQYADKTSEAFQDIVMNLTEHLDIFDTETVKWFFSTKNPKRVSPVDLISGISIFLTIPGEKMESFAPVFRLIINQCLSYSLSQPETKMATKRRHIWFLVDEAGTIGKIPMLKTAMAQGRSKGIQVTVALQAISDFAETYGENNSKAIRDYCKTTIVFGTNNDEFARSLSAKTGYYTEEKVSTSNRGSTWTGDSSTNKSSEYRPAVDASDIQRLYKLKKVLVFTGGDWFIADAARYFEIPLLRDKSSEIVKKNEMSRRTSSSEDDSASVPCG